LIRALASYGIEGGRQPGYTGVWAKGRKLASIGVAVRRWVTLHGFALNVTTDLSRFSSINPCGLESAVMGSVLSLTGRSVALEEMATRVADEFGTVFRRELRGPPSDVLR
jgi:lipoate-protein ligase B